MPRLVRAPIVAVLVAALVGPSLGAIQQWYKQTELPLPDSSFCNSCTCLADEWGFERCLPPISAERYWSNGLNAGTNGYDLTSTVTGLVPGVTYTVRMYAFRSDLDSSKDAPYPSGNAEAEYVSKFVVGGFDHGYCEPGGYWGSCDWHLCHTATYTVPAGETTVEVVTAAVGGSHDCDCLLDDVTQEIHSCGPQNSVSVTSGNTLQYIAMGHKFTFTDSRFE